MTKTVLVENRTNLKFLYSVNLKVYTDSEVISITTLKDAIDFIKENKSTIDLIICRSHMDTLPSAFEISAYLKDEHLDIPLIVLGDEKRVEDQAVLLEDFPQLKDLLRFAAQALGITAKMMATKSVPDYFPFPISYFETLKNANCDVFIKNGENEKGESFRKWCKEGDGVFKEDLKRLITVGIEVLFVKAKDRLRFVNQYSQNLQTYLEQEDITTDDRIEKTDSIYEITANTLQEIGITEESVQLIQTTVTSIHKVVEGHNTLSKLLGALLSENFSFRYKHCQILTLVSHKIINLMEWGNKEQQEKLSFVAFLHDIMLKSDKECRIHSQDDLVKSGLPPDDFHRVANHARLAAQYIKAYPRAPIGADDIVLHHHGSRTGEGFSENYTRTSPLTAVFIVAEELAIRILEVNEKKKKFDWATHIKEICSKYDRPAFRKVLQTLEQLSKTLAT